MSQEIRNDGLIVDINGGVDSRPVGRTADGKHNVIVNPRQEREFSNMTKETRLMKAMNEVRALGAKSLSTEEREKLKPQLQAIFEKYQLTAKDFGI